MHTPGTIEKVISFKSPKEMEPKESEEIRLYAEEQTLLVAKVSEKIALLNQPIIDHLVEKEYQRRLEIIFDGHHESCTYGIADVYNGDSIIEIKKATKWRDGMGQLDVYGDVIPHTRLILYLFGPLPNQPGVEELITAACHKRNIEVMFHDVHYNGLKEDYIASHAPGLKSNYDIGIQEHTDMDTLTPARLSKFHKTAVKLMRELVVTMDRMHLQQQMQLADSARLLASEIADVLERSEQFLEGVNDVRRLAREFMSERMTLGPSLTIGKTNFESILRQWAKDKGHKYVGKIWDAALDILKIENIKEGRAGSTKILLGIGEKPCTSPAG